MEGKNITKFVLAGLAVLVLLFGGWYIKNKNDTQQYVESIREPLKTVFAAHGKLSSIRNTLGGNPKPVLQEVDSNKEKIIKAKQDIEKVPVTSGAAKDIHSLAIRISDLSLAYADKIQVAVPKVFVQMNKLEEDKKQFPKGRSNLLDNTQQLLITEEYGKIVGSSGVYPLQMELQSIIGAQEYDRITQ